MVSRIQMTRFCRFLELCTNFECFFLEYDVYLTLHVISSDGEKVVWVACIDFALFPFALMFLVRESIC